MKIFSKVRFAAGIATMAFATFVFGAEAQAAAIKVGVLTCHVSSGWGFVIGSSKDLRCDFSPISGTDEHYTGTVSKFGVDIGYSKGGVIIWNVIAPASNLEPGTLRGGYAGATASASFGVGAGANVLIGGSHKSITLQPLSISGETGLNVAAGIGAIRLDYSL